METHQVHFIYFTFVFPGRTKYASYGRGGHGAAPVGRALQVRYTHKSFKSWDVFLYA